jgi:hypothetical protein
MKPDETGAAGALGEACPPVPAEAGLKPDNTHTCRSEPPVGRCGRLNAEQITFLVVGLVLALAIVVAALILAKNL